MQPSKPLTDQNLLAMMKAGNQQALIELYKMCYESIRNYILKNNGSEDDVKDTVQDALVITWQKSLHPDFELSAKYTTYIYSVAKNLWWNKLRKMNRETDLDSLAIEPYEHESETKKIDYKILKKCMDEIGDTCKKLLGYFYYDGYNMNEVAKLMEFANSDTAKAKKYQCLKKLEVIVKSKLKKEDIVY